MTQPETYYACSGGIVATAIAIAALTLVITNGRDWAQRHAKLEAELTAVKKELHEWRALGKTPAVLSRALENYRSIHDALIVAESGQPYKANPYTITRCFSTNVPESERTFAGL